MKAAARATVGRPKEVADQQILAVARRCFIQRGSTIPAVEIARELGVSHTTLFNRFGSKEGLLLAALGAPEHVPWVDALDAGPDARLIRDQLIEHAVAMSAYFRDLQAGFAVLQAAGIDLGVACGRTDGPVRAFRAFVAWLERARDQGGLAPCDAEVVASTILSVLQGWAFTERVSGSTKRPAAGDQYVERFIDVLWQGIGPEER